jgi:hypothetical protein
MKAIAIGMRGKSIVMFAVFSYVRSTRDYSEIARKCDPVGDREA